MTAIEELKSLNPNWEDKLKMLQLTEDEYEDEYNNRIYYWVTIVKGCFSCDPDLNFKLRGWKGTQKQYWDIWEKLGKNQSEFKIIEERKYDRLEDISGYYKPDRRLSNAEWSNKYHDLNPDTPKVNEEKRYLKSSFR